MHIADLGGTYAIFRERLSCRSPANGNQRKRQGRFFKSGRVACRRKVHQREYQRRQKSYSIAEFSLVMALQEIARTVAAAAEKAK
jgi:hypothetical protein